MDANRALADLLEISSQVEAAVVAGRGGEVLAATLPEEPARALAERAAALVEAAPAAEGRTVVQLEAATREGSLFVVRDAERTIAASTAATPTAALVFYDLRTCLKDLATAEPEPAPKPGRRPRKTREGDGAAA